MFVRGVIPKLMGPTKDCVDGCSFDRIEDLIKHLRGQFSGCHYFKTYHHELIKIAMLPNESVSEYGSRVQYLVRGARAALSSK